MATRVNNNERQFGVGIEIFNTDPRWGVEIQRAPDSSGSPDTANASVIDFVPGWVKEYVDPRPAGSGPWHYRWKTSLSGCSAGSWSDWVGANPMEIPEQVPNVPQLNTLNVLVFEDGSVWVAGGADVDTASMVVEWGSGLSDSNSTMNGRTFQTTSSDTLDKGESTTVTVTPWSDTGASGRSGLAKDAQVERPGPSSVTDVTPSMTINIGTSDPTNQNFDITASAGSDVSSPSLEYKWRAELSPTDSETTYDHNDDGNDDWISIADDGTDTVQVSRPNSSSTAMLEVVIRDTSIRSAPNHPKSSSTALAPPQSAESDGIGTSVVATTTDPGEGTDNDNPDGTFYAVYTA